MLDLHDPDKFELTQDYCFLTAAHLQLASSKGPDLEQDFKIKFTMPCIWRVSYQSIYPPMGTIENVQTQTSHGDDPFIK